MTWSQEPPRLSEEGKTPEPDGADWRQTAAEGLAGREKAKINSQKAENPTPKNRKEDSTGYKAAVKQIEEASRDLREGLEQQDQQIQAMSDDQTRVKDELAQTKDELARIKGELARTKDELARTKVELEKTKADLAEANDISKAKSTELAKAQSLLSPPDRISEAEVLEIVRGLNKNITQIAANLAEEWGKLPSPRFNKAPPNKKELDTLSQFYGSTLVRRVLNRDPSAVTLLVQSTLCYVVTQITSSWRPDCDKRWWILGSIYRRLSASGKRTPHAAIEAILTKTRGTGGLG